MINKGPTIEKYFSSMMDRKVAANNDIDDIKSTTINGWRSLHLNQMFKYGYGSLALNEDVEFQIGSESDDPVAGR